MSLTHLLKTVLKFTRVTYRHFHQQNMYLNKLKKLPQQKKIQYIANYIQQQNHSVAII